MSLHSAAEPVCNGCETAEEIETIITARCRSIGAFSVGRVLPARSHRAVGPFLFFDHMGPAELVPGEGMDVRPHPHIHLATVTYLFEGVIDHRDSLGYHQAIRPGAINWMTAGRGIVHSERSPQPERAGASRLDGIQLWVGLPKAHEDVEPSFVHHPAESIPECSVSGATVRVLIGSAFGVTSPVETLHPMMYGDARLPAGSELAVPSDHPERAIYVASGEVSVGAQRLVGKEMAVLKRGHPVTIHASGSDASVMIIAGEPLDGVRHMWWNFVSSSLDRIERAKAEWKAGEFPKVPGEDEFIPLPE